MQERGRRGAVVPFAHCDTGSDWAAFPDAVARRSGLGRRW